jgi:hypothetical protein
MTSQRQGQINAVGTYVYSERIVCAQSNSQLYVYVIAECKIGHALHHVNARSRSYWTNERSGKYLARTVLPPK